MSSNPHSFVVGGSNADRRLNCPRSLVLERRLPAEAHDRSTVYALEGSALHELIGAALIDGLDETEVEVELLPFRYERDGQTFTVDQQLWQRKGAPVLGELRDHLDWLNRTYGSGRISFRVEEQLVFPGVEGAFGTADVCGMVGGTPFIIDLKFGHNRVEAEGSAQLMFYAAAYLSSLETPLPASQRLELAIIQSTSSGDDAELRTWSPTVGDVLSFAARLAQAIAEAEACGDAATIVKGPWCRWAPCKAICPLHVSAVERLAAAVRASADRENFAEVLATGLALSGAVKEWVDAIETKAHNYLANGGRIPGYQLVNKRAGPRAWAVDEAVVLERLTELGVDRDAIRKLLPPAQIERIMRDAGGIELPSDLVTKPEPSGTRVAPVGQGEPAKTTDDLIRRLVELTGAHGNKDR